MPYDVELPDETRREMMVLSWIYRAYHSKGDRNRVESVIGETIDEVTGLVKSEADLKPANQAIRGRDYVKAAMIDPEEMALARLERNEHDGSTPALCYVKALTIMVKRPDPLRPEVMKEEQHGYYPTNERGRAEEEASYIQRNNPGWMTNIRTMQGREALTPTEAEAVGDLKHLFSQTLHQFAERGWVEMEPSCIFDPLGPADLPTRGHDYKRGVDDKGTVFAARFTDEGIDEALRRIHGDPYWSQPGPFSSLEAQTTDVRARAVSANPWANALYRKEQTRQ
mgnify:FL=1